MVSVLLPPTVSRRILLRLGKLVERGLERIGRRPLAAGEAPVLEPYTGYATPEGWVIRGRVLTHLRRADPVPEQSRWVNLRQMASLFFTDEVGGVRVEAKGRTTESDAEGYVILTVPSEEGGPWAKVTARIAEPPGAEVICPVRVPGERAEIMVISDIDDTVIRTGAYSLFRNLWTTFTGSALTREVHQDAVRLISTLEAKGRNPVFYVSSSPWNMHAFLDGLLTARGVPRGPMFLRDLGLTERGIGESHLGHKGAAIDHILAAAPDLPAMLLGDTGQHDAEVYLAAVQRHPGRIRAVALREPKPGVGQAAVDATAAIEAAGVPCWHGPGFDGALAYWKLDVDGARNG